MFTHCPFSKGMVIIKSRLAEALQGKEEGEGERKPVCEAVVHLFCIRFYK